MGRSNAKIEITLSLGEHNDPEDEDDREKARELIRRINDITEAPEFADIVLFGPALDGI